MSLIVHKHFNFGTFFATTVWKKEISTCRRSTSISHHCHLKALKLTLHQLKVSFHSSTHHMEHGPRPPPTWIINWRILVGKAMIWAKQAQRFLRTPISLPMTMASTEPSTTRSQRPPCQHKYIKRSGNRHASFAQCLVEVWRRMGPTHRVLSFLTIATAFLHHNCVGQLMDKPGSIEQEGTFQAFEEFWVLRFDCESGAQESSQVQGRGGNGGRRGTSWETSGTTTHCGWRGGGVDKQPGRLQLGRGRELTGQLERSS